MKNVLIQPLVELGLTKLETAIYVFLLENSPATGYSIAKGIGKPDANTYRAIESLHSKGAIVVEDGKTKLCRAISPDELLNGFQRRFDDLKQQAKTELKRLKSSPADNRIYQLQTTNQVISRFRSMFSSCQRVAVLDFFPFMLRELRHDVISAAKRGVKITIQVYQPCDLPGVEMIVAHDGESIVKKWPGTWANGVFDGEEYLLSFLSKDGQEVIQAVWSNNQYLSWIYFSEIVHEIMAHHLENGFKNNLPMKEMRKLFMKYKKMIRLKESGYKEASSFFITESKTKKTKE
jgi:sugar-specific transcriptional regulator TrmB